MKSCRKLFLLALAVVTLAAIPSSADWHTATVGVGESGTYPMMAIDPVRNLTFTANTPSNTITVVNGRTNQVQTWFPGQNPRFLAVNPVTGKLYVSINGSATNDTVVIFDTTGTIIKKMPVKKEPWSMVVDSDNDRLYVANSGSDTISIFASDTLWLSYPVNDGPAHLFLNPINHALFITYGNSNSVGTLNLGQYSIMHITTGQRAIGLAINAAANKVYVANALEDSVTVIDCAIVPPEAIKKIKVGDYPMSVVTDPGAKTVYVANNLGGTVTAINCSTNAVVSDVPVKLGPDLMAINPSTGKLYITHGMTDNIVTVLDWKSGLRDSVVLGHAPSTLALNPATNKIYVRVEAGNPDSLAVIDGSDFDTTITASKSGTQFAAVNHITGDVFFSNSSSDNVTVIKANGDTMTIVVGDDPRMITVNPLSNKVFVCNFASKSVSVINGASYSVERTITVDTLPTIVAVNPLTNYIYVNSFFASANRVKVIDGKDWDTTSVLVGSKPFSIAVNPATNRIYVGNDVSNTVTVIDGASHTVLTSVSVNRPYKIDINPVTNKIYAAKLQTGGQVAVIDGATNTSTNVTVGNWPSGVAVNRANNKIYVTNYNDSTVTEIDGATNGTSTIKVGVHPEWIAADPVTGKVFVSNSDGSSLSIIDCASRSVKTMTMPAGPRQVVVNPAIGKVYLACYTAGRAVVLDQVVEQDTKVTTDDNEATWKYIFTGNSKNQVVTSTNHWTPYNTTISEGVFCLATNQSFWKFGTYSSSTDSSLDWLTGNDWRADTAIYGDNVYLRGALETQSATTNNLGAGTPFMGNITTYVMYRIDYAAPTIAWWDSLDADNDSLDGYGPYTVKAVITDFSGVDYATLYYQMSGKSWPSVAMTRAAADTFIAEIPAQIVTEGDTAVMSYMIDAGDHANIAINSSNTISSNIRSFRLRNLTGVEGNPTDPALPKIFALQAAYPNPSRGQTVIKYQLPKASDVRLQVYNVAGQLVKTINEGQKPAGYHQVKINDNTMANGIYFYQLKAGNFSATKKLLIVK
ncbi:T9SS type A sorting domain-containing protein [candidate division TA06 bacterium]|nr:T9SS type A sorting domain-containing protein [candidate division TA06 bacterium]